MNARTLNIVLLGISLGLVGVVGYLLFVPKADRVPVQIVTKTDVVTNRITQIAVRKVSGTNLFLDLLNRPQHWLALESTNYAIYVNNLRNFGCPEETVRDIVIADIVKLYARRRGELRAQLPRPKYWQSEETFAKRSPEYQLVLRQVEALDQEERALVKSLLDVDLDQELAKYSRAELTDVPAAFDFLPEEKGRQVTDLIKHYEEAEAKIYERTRGFMLAEDEEELRKLKEQQEQELAKLLTPQELEQYQLSQSQTARNLREMLGTFEPTEEEFRKIFQVQKALDDTATMKFSADPEKDAEIRARVQEEAGKELQEEIKKALGEKRFGEYQRATDGDYQMLLSLSERFSLPAEKAVKVYDVKVAADRQRERIELDPMLTEDQRAAALLAIARETERTVSETLGKTAFKAYQRLGGQWLNELVPQLAPEEK